VTFKPVTQRCLRSLRRPAPLQANDIVVTLPGTNFKVIYYKPTSA
jgi:hypothetical protein